MQCNPLAPSSHPIRLWGNHMSHSTQYAASFSVRRSVSSGRLRLAAGALLSFALAACGGGGGGSSATASIPVQQFAYTANLNGGISAYSINAATGALTSITGSPFATGTALRSATVSPAGTFLYAAGGADTVSAYRINSSTGALTPVGSPVPAGDFVQSVIVNPAGTFAYALNAGNDAMGSARGYAPSGSISIFSINPSTGELTPASGGSLVTPNEFLTSMTINRTGAFAYVVGNYCTPFTVNQGTFESYTYCQGTGSGVSVYTINPTTGALTPVAGSPFTTGASPSSITINPAGTFAYVANQADGTVSAYTINQGTGALTPVTGSPFTTGASPSSITINPAGTFAYVTGNEVSVYSINQTTGALTSITGSPFAVGTKSNIFSIAIAYPAMSRTLLNG